MSKKVDIQYDLKYIPYSSIRNFAQEEYTYEILGNSEEKLISSVTLEHIGDSDLSNAFDINQEAGDAERTYRVVMQVWDPGPNQPEDGGFWNSKNDPDATLMINTNHIFTVDLSNDETHQEVIFPVPHFIV
ncbi:hypothetical protein [Pseudomonas fluorescens]|uniref:Uncharacterized protein n=1 Tax=Pseudomonas fluorescens TaxID=294 RepID=A0A5E6WPQ3_PSEFL|nr:hypothetical protein [Pseudomonas fluorescens]VVN30307.1 hypothetical protein PS659_04838 [Pseudomonas fluorescens]